MGVIFNEQCKVDGVVCVQEISAKFTSEFYLGAFKIDPLHSSKLSERRRSVDC